MIHSSEKVGRDRAGKPGAPGLGNQVLSLPYPHLITALWLLDFWGARWWLGVLLEGAGSLDGLNKKDPLVRYERPQAVALGAWGLRTSREAPALR